MRVIKFRAWNKNIERMSKPFELYSDVCDFTNENGLGNVKYLTDEVVMQYTGKVDSKGNEIYEGDIIEFDRKEWGGDDNIHLVSWDEKEAEWSWGGGTTSDMDWRTVIGNIYENPELISQS